jgi:hypothetical protein
MLMMFMFVCMQLSGVCVCAGERLGWDDEMKGEERVCRASILHGWNLF